MQELLEKYEGSFERCGVILTDGTIVEIDNIAPEKDRAFIADPEQLLPYLDADNIAATWHTHPDKEANLSSGDAETFLFWPKQRHYIVGNDGIATYVVKNNRVIRE